jgi:hypothetical protein
VTHSLRIDVVLSEVTWGQVASLVLQRPWDGRCERCGLEEPTDPHHRWLRGQGGLDVPSNVAALGRRCHDWAHLHPYDATKEGWIVQAPYDFRGTKVTLASGMTVRFTDDYGYDITGWP